MHKHWIGAGSCAFALLVAMGIARADNRACAAPDVRHVAVPLDYARPQGGQFDLAYRLRPGSGAVRPLVIVIPGGPGGTLIREDRNVLSGGIPDDVPVVLTDPRGAGCNDDPRLTEDRDFTSEWLARDLLAIVADMERGRGERLDYILYGQSYGTVEATIAAAIAGRESRTPPRALVMEGTLGHAFTSYEQQFSAFQAEWHAQRDALPLRWQQLIRTGAFHDALGSNSLTWARLIDRSILRGYHADGDSDLEEQLASDVLLFRSLRSIGRTPYGDERAGESRLLRVIACEELTGDLYPGRDMRGGELVLTGSDACAGSRRLVRPYNAAQWPVAAPIVYFQGLHDAATPPAQARYHFDVERGAPRWLVTVDRAGHSVLSVTLAVGDCRDGLWGAIGSDLGRLPAAAKACDALLQDAHVSVEHRDAVVLPLRQGP
ncbi:MAG: alpha/beta fold hydrolase [Alphaproteobacteria bacterium]|nr:alpha/beta fold hydrolase [Alphaproteobacteria bacterium]